MSNGLLTNAELVDTLVVDLNNLPKLLMDGQFIQFCGTVAQMGQKLANLRKGIKADLDSKDKTIEMLKENIRAMGEGVTDMSAAEYIEKEGLNNGGN